jgi:phosphotriesterase-related protein
VDVTVIGQGRYIPRIRRIAEQVPELNIVVATGCYTFDEVPMSFWRRTPDDEALAGRPMEDPMLGCDLVVELCRRGLAGRMVLSHDTCCHIDWFSPDRSPR